MDKEEPGRLQSVGLQRVRRLKQPARTYTPPSLPHFRSRIYRFVGEGKVGMIWENGIETRKLSYVPMDGRAW